MISAMLNLLSTLLPPLLWFTLIPLVTPTNPNFVSKFSITETWSTDNQVHSVMQGTAECPPQGCQSALSLNFSLSSITGGLLAICFLYDQTEYNCKNCWQKPALGVHTITAKSILCMTSLHNPNIKICFKALRQEHIVLLLMICGTLGGPRE